MCFRQGDVEDRDLIGSAMLMQPRDKEDLARLPTGEAFFITGNYHRPRRIRTRNLHDTCDLSPMGDSELKALISVRP